MAATETELVITDDTTEHQLHLAGTHLDSGSAAPGFRSVASAFELAETSPENPSIPSDYRAWDLAHIGVTSDHGARVAAGQGFEDTVISFAISTHANQTHPAVVYVMIWIDHDRDGEYDIVLEKFPLFHWSTFPSDVYWTYTYDFATEETRWQVPVHSLPGGEIEADLLNTDTYILSARAADLGLTEGVSTFDYRVTTFVTDFMWPMDESEVHTFDAARPGLHLTGSQTAPMFWDDLDGATISVTGDRRAYLANGSRGLLLIHHHNANGERAQVIDVIPTVGEGPRETGGRAIP
jgi:hypothetical protein